MYFWTCDFKYIHKIINVKHKEIVQIEAAEVAYLF